MSADAFAGVADVIIPAMARILEFVWRRQVAAGIQRSMVARSHGLTSGQSPVLAVGFADMVGFTLLSQHLSNEELAAVVRRFEEISHDIVTSARGRVVKMIGDEVMFVTDTVAAAARIGLDLADAYADDDLLSDVRVGMASGPVLARDGDYFGPTVNLAHRIVNIGNPGTVLMSDEFHRALEAEAPGEFTAQALRPRMLKDLGRVQLWWCGRAGQEADGTGAAADRRRNVRWERLSEVLRDLEELRGVGERLLSAQRPGPAGSQSWRRTVAMAKGPSSNRRLERLLRVAPQVDQPARAPGEGDHGRLGRRVEDPHLEHAGHPVERAHLGPVHGQLVARRRTGPAARGSRRSRAAAGRRRPARRGRRNRRPARSAR